MKFYLFAAAIALCASTPAHAEADIDLCASIEKLADKIMESRQVGVPMSSVMEITAKATLTGSLLQRIVIDAYQSPGYSTEEYKRRQRIEFAAKWAALCYASKTK